jgi:hypothetical protein
MIKLFKIIVLDNGAQVEFIVAGDDKADAEDRIGAWINFESIVLTQEISHLGVYRVGVLSEGQEPNPGRIDPIVYRYSVDYALKGGGTQTHLFEERFPYEHKTQADLLEHFKTTGQALYGTADIQKWGHASTRENNRPSPTVADLPELGPQEPPNNPMIYNRKRADGTYPAFEGFFDR